jgi:N utilization substance protein A
MDYQDFVQALQQIAEERKVSREEVLQAFEEALWLGYIRRQKRKSKEDIEAGRVPNVEVHLDPQSGQLEVLEIKKVVEKVEDEDKEISLEEARSYDPEVQVGEEMEFPIDPEIIGQIALSFAKQMLTQKLKEAERNRVQNEYKDRIGEILIGQVSRIDNRGNVYVDLGRGEALMPPREQIPGERYEPGKRIKVYLKQVQRTVKGGPTLVISRAHEELLRYLLRQEVPEIAEGTVEVKAIAREAGSRSKVAVTSHHPNVDPIGACIGHKGQRVQAVSSELARERIDIIQWSPNPKEFIRNALSPAIVGEITLLGGDPPRAKVAVSKDQHSLAIGKAGQNVRLASRLTGYVIDFEELPEITDLDQAILRAAERQERTVSQEARDRFETLFSEDEG